LAIKPPKTGILASFSFSGNFGKPFATVVAAKSKISERISGVDLNFVKFEKWFGATFGGKLINVGFKVE
jgi:hypothetical protein